MNRLDHFEKSQRALERSLWTQRQSDAVYAASQKIIAQSLQVIRDATPMIPHLGNGEK